MKGGVGPPPFKLNSPYGSSQPSLLYSTRITVDIVEGFDWPEPMKPKKFVARTEL